MMNVGLFYPKLVKEFIVYLPRGFNDVGSGDYITVIVIGFDFLLLLSMNILVEEDWSQLTFFHPWRPLL